MKLPGHVGNTWSQGGVLEDDLILWERIMINFWGAIEPHWKHMVAERVLEEDLSLWECMGIIFMEATGPHRRYIVAGNGLGG